MASDPSEEGGKMEESFDESILMDQDTLDSMAMLSFGSKRRGSTETSNPSKLVMTSASSSGDSSGPQVSPAAGQVTPQEPTVHKEGGKVEEIANAGADNQSPDQLTAQIVASGSSQQQTGRFEEEIASTQQPLAMVTADHESVMEVDGAVSVVDDAKEHSITVSFSLM